MLSTVPGIPVMHVVFRCGQHASSIVIEEEVGQGAKESSKAASTDSGRFLVWHLVVLREFLFISAALSSSETD